MRFGNREVLAAFSGAGQLREICIFNWLSISGAGHLTPELLLTTQCMVADTRILWIISGEVGAGAWQPSNQWAPDDWRCGSFGSRTIDGRPLSVRVMLSSSPPTLYFATFTSPALPVILPGVSEQSALAPVVGSTPKRILSAQRQLFGHGYAVAVRRG
jgi:hypothetical protein